MKLNLFVMSLCSSQWTALVLPQSDPQVHARGGFYLHRILQRKYVRYTLYNLSLLSRGRRLCLFCLVFELNTAWSLSPSPLTTSDAGWNINTVVRAEWIHSLCLTAVCAFSIDTWQFLFLQAPSNSPSAGSHCCFNPVTHFSFHFCIFLPSFECFPFLSFQVIISLNDRFNIAVVFAALVIITAEGRGDARARTQLTCTGIHSCPLYFEQTCVSLPSVCVSLWSQG